MSANPTRLHKISSQRRSQRVILPVKILVSGAHPDGRPFSEEAFTSVVDVHGALLLLAEKVRLGQSLIVRNLDSNQELAGEVVGVGVPQAGKSEIGIDFLASAPRFWRISFPPEDWSPRSPEAKRITLAPPSISKASA